MSNAATALLRIAALASGAIVGALLARWVDDFMISQSQERVDVDKSRYAQGLTPIVPQPATGTSNVHTIDTIVSDENVY